MNGTHDSQNAKDSTERTEVKQHVYCVQRGASGGYSNCLLEGIQYLDL